MLVARVASKCSQMNTQTWGCLIVGSGSGFTVNLGSDSLGKSNDLGVSSVSRIHFGFGFIVNPDPDPIIEQPHNVIITFRVGRRRREMYCGHARLCVSVRVSVCPRPHAYTIARTRM